MKNADGSIEVKAVVTKVLSSKTEIIHDGGLHRTMERVAWRERQMMRRDREMLRGHGIGGRYDDCTRFESVDDVLPQRDWYAATTARVMARYTVNGQEYEREVVLTDDGTWNLAGGKIYLTLDPSRPEEPLRISRQSSNTFISNCLLIGSVLVLVLYIIVVALKIRS